MPYKLPKGKGILGCKVLPNPFRTLNQLLAYLSSLTPASFLFEFIRYKFAI